MKKLIILTLLISLFSAHADTTKSILFLAGKASHGLGEHEFYDGCKLLANALESSGLDLRTKIVCDAWPETSTFNDVDALVVYCDGNEQHLVQGHEEELQSMYEAGMGVVFLHYAVDGLDGPLDRTLLEVLGGYYDDEQSKNPVWTMRNPTIVMHAVTRGVKPFELKDEWYYNLRFGDVTPLLQAVSPNQDGKIHTLAWAYGKTAFGCTGGHFSSNWSQPDFRRLVLNGIVWAAGLEVPSGGVQSNDPVTVKHKTILHAIAKGDANDVRNHLLLGDDVNQPNKTGWTPLHFAAVRGKTECAKVLVSMGSQINARTSDQKTPLHLSADRSFMGITMLLIENGANIGAQDNRGWSPLHYAAEKDRVEVAACLISKGAEVDMLSKLGGTPLHEASTSASPEMIKLLLDSGADKTIQADNGKTPLDYAVEFGNKPAEALLK